MLSAVVDVERLSAVNRRDKHPRWIWLILRFGFWKPYLKATSSLGLDVKLEVGSFDKRRQAIFKCRPALSAQIIRRTGDVLVFVLYVGRRLILAARTNLLERVFCNRRGNVHWRCHET